MLDIMTDAQAVALFGLLGGIALGLAARVGRFCTLGAIEDALYGGDDRRLRMWALAIGTAVLVVHVASGFGWVDPAKSVYLQQKFSPLPIIIGGLMFGYGMALSGNCGYGALARLGGGDLRSLMIVLVMGLSAYVAMSGPLARLRVWAFPVEMTERGDQGFGPLIQRLFDVPSVTVGIVVGCLALAIGLGSSAMRRAPGHIFWGIVVGLAIGFGWIGTAWVTALGFDGEVLRSHTFAAPLGDTLIYLMTASGNSLSFGVGSVTGVVIGAVLGSYSRGHFRWEACEDPRELKRQLLGAVLMGPGAILAAGCSVGQGLSAFSLLAFSAPLAALSIFVGAAIGLRQLITGFAPVR